MGEVCGPGKGGQQWESWCSLLCPWLVPDSPSLTGCFHGPSNWDPRPVTLSLQFRVHAAGHSPKAREAPITPLSPTAYKKKVQTLSPASATFTNIPSHHSHDTLAFAL